MAIDYGAVLYDPVYAEIGVPATMTVTGADTGAAITVIDDTRPKTLPAATAVDVRGMGPERLCAHLRTSSKRDHAA